MPAVPNASPAFLSYGASMAAEQIGSDLVERMIEGWHKAALEIAGAVSPKAAAALLFALAIIRELAGTGKIPVSLASRNWAPAFALLSCFGWTPLAYFRLALFC